MNSPRPDHTLYLESPGEFRNIISLHRDQFRLNDIVFVYYSDSGWYEAYRLIECNIDENISICPMAIGTGNKDAWLTYDQDDESDYDSGSEDMMEYGSDRIEPQIPTLGTVPLQSDPLPTSGIRLVSTPHIIGVDNRNRYGQAPTPVNIIEDDEDVDELHEGGSKRRNNKKNRTKKRKNRKRTNKKRAKQFRVTKRK